MNGLKVHLFSVAVQISDWYEVFGWVCSPDLTSEQTITAL